MKTYKQLYRVYSTVSEFQFAGRDFYGVRVAWFVKDREEPIIPYERIADYHMNDPYLEVTSLGQHFTFPEALGLSNYLFEVRDFESQIEVAKLPLRASTLPIYDQFDLDDGECFIKLNESKITASHLRSGAISAYVGQKSGGAKLGRTLKTH